MGYVCLDRTRACLVSRRNWKHKTAIGAGFVLSGFFLWLALLQVDIVSLGKAFATIKYIPVLLCAGAISLGIMLRALRWRVIAGFPTTEQHNFSRATNIGTLANLLFPGRAGEFIRVITLAKLSRSSLPGPLASALIDRLIDAFVLLASASVLYWLFPISTLIDKWLTVFLIVGCIITLLIVFYARSSGIGEVLIARLTQRWLHRWPPKPEIFLTELRNEFRRLLSSWLSIELMLLAALILLIDYGAIAALLQAFALSLPFEAPLLLWVFLAAGSALPSGPGYVGVYQVAAVWALSLFNVSAPTAVAIATVLQITTLAVAIVMAGPAALGVSNVFGFRKKQLNREKVNLNRFSITTGIRSLYANRSLLRALVKRDIETRYRGTLLGFLWALVYPLMMLAVYAFVFGGVFNARWGSGGDMKDFVLMLYCGLIVHGVFSETLTRSPAAVLSNPSYVKKVVFPLELLPFSHLASALFNALVGLGLLCIFLLIQRHAIHITALFIPLVLMPLLLLTAGLAWFLAALGVFFRDVGQMIGVVMSVLLFLSPVFYPVSSTSGLAQKLIHANPLTYPIEELRAVLIIGIQPDWLHWLTYTFAAILVAIFGLWIFQKSRPAFADVI